MGETVKKWSGLFLLTLLIGCQQVLTPEVSSQKTKGYTNPVEVAAPGIGNGTVESCADPSTIYADGYWYTYCTKDPLNDDDVNADGDYNFNNMPILRSADLVNWTYIGNVFDEGRNFPSYVEPTAGLFAPAIERFNGRYYLYYSITDTKLEARGDDSAIGVATSNSPAGPWVDSGGPVVEPSEAGCCPGSRRATIDPEVVEVGGQKYMFYGSYFGGISARDLSADGLTTDPASQTQITIDNRYEAPYIVRKNGYYYLFVSATDCCRGPLTGYAVFAGRSRNVLGPYVDREGVSLLDEELPEGPSDGRFFARVGGTVVLAQNGNRWVGPGHNAVFQDFSGQWWTTYHAVDRFDPYFQDAINIFPGGCGPEDPPAELDRCGDLTKRPLLLDPVDWIDGWPTVRGGNWASDGRQPAPAAQPGQKTRYRTEKFREIRLGRLVDRDEFNGSALDRRWNWVREPAAGQVAVEGGLLRFETQDGDLFVDSDNAPVLKRPSVAREYVVQTRVRLAAPLEKCPDDCRFVQAGLVIYGDDDNFIKLADVSIFNTRQTEFAKELAPVPQGYPRYGNTVVGPPAEWTLLRIVKQIVRGEERYTAYTKRDVPGGEWVRGGTWTHELGRNAKVSLVSFGGAGYTASFDYVRVYRLR